jgi:hypothetical protein
VPVLDLIHLKGVSLYGCAYCILQFVLCLFQISFFISFLFLGGKKVSFRSIKKKLEGAGMTDSEAPTTAASAEAMIAAILVAESHHVALGLPPSGQLQPAAVRTAFRRRALICHPDKVRASTPAESARAEAAFKRIAAAFEALHEPRAGATPEPRAKRRRRASSSAGQAERSEEHGHEASWDEWERNLRRFEDLERWFVGLQSARYADRHTRRLLEKAAKIVTELDERAGVDENPNLVAVDVELADGAGTGGRSDAIQLLANLLIYMREHYMYCIFCAARFEDVEDLERNCPGLSEAEHGQADDEELAGEYDY